MKNCRVTQAQKTVLVAFKPKKVGQDPIKN